MGLSQLSTETTRTGFPVQDRIQLLIQQNITDKSK
jgi:hypothetical protein